MVLDIDEEPGPELQRVLDAYLVRVRQDLHRGWLPAVSATHHGGQDRRLSPSSAVRFCTPQLCLRPRAPVANHGLWLMRQILWTMTSATGEIRVTRIEALPRVPHIFGTGGIMLGRRDQNQRFVG